MSKHSKWSKIKRQKETTDNRRGALFSRLSKAIIVATQEAGVNPDTNIRLRIAIDQALAENMTKSTIQRVIERGSGSKSSESILSFTLEGYGPEGSALLISVATDNRNRTVGEIRHLLQEIGGSLGDAGSTRWMFERCGKFELNVPEEHIEDVELLAIEAGASDISRKQNNTIEVRTIPEKLAHIIEVLKQNNYTLLDTTITWIPKTPFPISPHAHSGLKTLIDRLMNRDDVVDVATNAVLK